MKDITKTLLTISTFVMGTYIAYVNGYVKGCKTIVESEPEKYMKKEEA
jgi:hypothetical protein